jgi:hypothetical protein
LSDDDFVKTLRLRATETCSTTDVPRPQTAVTTCKTCKQSFIACVGEALPIDQATAARLTCDAEYIGGLESNELTRVKPTATTSSASFRVIARPDSSTFTISSISRMAVATRCRTVLMCFGCHQRASRGAIADHRACARSAIHIET